MIRKNKPLFVEMPKRDCVDRIIFEGKLNPIIFDDSEDYIIPTFSPELFYKYNVNDIELYNKYSINLADFNYDSIAINIYKKYKNLFENYYEKESWAYGILLENINYYFEYIQKFTKEKVKEIFENKDDKILVEKAMNGELSRLNKQIEYIKKMIRQLKKSEKKKDSDL